MPPRSNHGRNEVGPMTALSADRPDFSERIPENEQVASSATLHGDSYADIVERLFGEYHSVLSLHRISEIVAGARSDLSGTPKGALAELIERLARQRIVEQLS